jgi:hypothetical protein
VAGFCVQGNEHSGCIKKMLEISWQAEILLASQK